MKKILFIFFLLPSILLAQEFKATVNKSVVSVGERFTLEFKTDLGGSSFTPPEFENVDVLGGPNMSESSISINGKRSQSFTVSYVLRAKSEGSIKIGSATLNSKKGNFSSDPITVKVVKQSQSKQNQTQNIQQNQNDNVDLSASIFIKQFVDKKTAYLGEQILVTYRIYMAEDIIQYSSNSPVYNGFYAQNIDLKNDNEISRELINGKMYTIATLKKVILTPQKTGQLEIDPLEMQLRVRLKEIERNRGFWGFPSFKEVDIKVESNTEKISVQAFPTNDQPSSFDGAVGQFELEARVDQNVIKANEAVNYTITISGNGNIELLSDPKVKFPNDFEVYEPKVKKNINYNVGGASGKKTFEYVLIPRFGGEFELKPITLSYFDPKKSKYITLETEPIKLSVSKADGGVTEASIYAPTSKEDIQIIGKDIRFIKTDIPNFERKKSPFFNSLSFYSIIFLGFSFTGIFWFLLSVIRKKEKNAAFMAKKAGGVAKKHLIAAQKLLQQNEAGFYEAIAKALFGYLSSKLNLPLSSLDRENIVQELTNRGVSNDLIQDLTKALDECEMVRFAPGIVRGKEEMLSSSKEIIEKIEHEL